MVPFVLAPKQCGFRYLIRLWSFLFMGLSIGLDGLFQLGKGVVIRQVRGMVGI